MKKVLSLLIFIFAVQGFWYCEKKKFKTFRIKGELVDWFNNRGVAGVIDIMGHKSTDYDKRISLGNHFTNEDGSFNTKVSATKSGDYSFSFGSAGVPGSVEKDQKIKDNSTADFGKIFLPHPFVCKVNISYTSGRNANLIIGEQPNTKSFPPNTHTVYFNTRYFTREQFQSDPNYYLTYLVMGPGISDNKTLIIPLGTRDTVSVDVSF